MHSSVIGSSDPKSCVEESEIGAKLKDEVEDVEAEAGAEVKEEDTTEDDKIADDMATEEETMVEEMHKAAERQYFLRDRRRADLNIGDKESRKRHSLDNVPKRLETGSRGRENDKDDTLPDDEDVGKENETEDEKPEEEAKDEEEETWFKVGEQEARFEVVALGCILVS